MAIEVRTDPDLFSHLSTFEHDEATVGSLLFNGGRLAYPGRKTLENQLGYIEPYTMDLEARVIDGMGQRWNSAGRFLARLATEHVAKNWHDPTLELLWTSHHSFAYRGNADSLSLDRLVAALVCIELNQGLVAKDILVSSTIIEAAEVLVNGLYSVGLPPTHEGLEELFDGAPPACVGLGLVDL